MISRRSFAFATAASAALSGLSRVSLAAAAPAEGWRRFEVTTRLDLAEITGPAQAWIPLASFDQPDWVRVGGTRWRTSADAQADRVTSNGADLLHVRWDTGTRFAEVTSTVTTRDRTAAIDAPRADAELAPAERALYLRGTAAAPTDGLIKERAEAIVAGHARDIDKAQALFQWVVENTFRSLPVRGCGEGEVLAMLKTGVLGGKCADLNPLFVALARAAGLPARDLYGIRVAPSRLGLNSLGPATPTVTKAQHCRAEVFLEGFGWTAMDPADVRKVMVEETPAGLPLNDPKVVAARARLFGAWEGNWVPFNAANDVILPGRSNARPVNFLMYPQIETATGMLDCYSADQVKYSITAKEIPV